MSSFICVAVIAGRASNAEVAKRNERNRTERHAGPTIPDWPPLGDGVVSRDGSGIDSETGRTEHESPRCPICSRCYFNSLVPVAVMGQSDTGTITGTVKILLLLLLPASDHCYRREDQF